MKGEKQAASALPDAVSAMAEFGNKRKEVAAKNNAFVRLLVHRFCGKKKSAQATVETALPWKTGNEGGEGRGDR